jgi:hypothetical protein
MREKTNVQLVKGFMEVNPHGALAQAFVIEAVTKYAKQCSTAKGKAQLRKAMKNGAIHPDAWIGCAEEWLKVMKEDNRPIC